LVIFLFEYYSSMLLIVSIIIRGPAEKQIMEPEEAVTEPDDEVYGCLSSEDSPHMSDEDKELQRLINEKKRTGHTGLGTLQDPKNRLVNGIMKKYFVMPFHGCILEGSETSKASEIPPLTLRSGQKIYCTMKTADLLVINCGVFSH
jgi:hypothetical protein